MEIVSTYLDAEARKILIVTWYTTLKHSIMAFQDFERGPDVPKRSKSRWPPKDVRMEDYWKIKVRALKMKIEKSYTGYNTTLLRLKMRR